MFTTFTNFKRTCTLSLALAILLMTGLAVPVSAQISITATGSSYSENFNGLGSAGTAYLSGWSGYRYAGTGTIGPLASMTVGDGSSTTGAVYNAGTTGAADRAMGMLAGATTIARMGAQYVNNTGVTITSINFAGTMEQWRSGSSSSANEVDAFGYSFDATNINTGTWTAFTAMDLDEKLTALTDNTAKDGNNAANRTSLIGTLSGLSWAPGTSMWIRWSDVNDAGSDALLAIDDFSMAFNLAAVQFGKGTASVTPFFIHGTVSQTVTVNVHGQASYTLTNANVVVPSIFSWSHNPGDVTLTGGGSPSVAVSGDTVQVSGMTIGGTDSIRIAINNVTPPDTTDQFTFPVQTGVAPDSIYSLASSPFSVVYGTSKSIVDVKTNDVNGVPLLIGKYVTTRGIVTVANQFAGPAYIQDNGAGIAIFDSTFSNHVTIGDEVVVVGIVSPFSGLCELGSTLLVQTISTGNVVEPLVVTPTQIRNDGAAGVENYEGLLVRLNGVVLRDFSGNPVATWTVSGSGVNYHLITTGADSCQIRVDKDVDYAIAMAPAPQSAFDVVGVVSQFKSATPFIGGYQFMPRLSADIMSSGPLFAALPMESNLTRSSFTVSWTSVNNGTTRLRYGTTLSYELGVLAPDNVSGLSHSINVTGLTPATIYHVQAFSVGNSSDTSTSTDLVVSTSSPLTSTGQMNIYFNKNVDNSVSLGENALGNQDLVSLVLNRINHAHYSIDVALYSLSGSGYGDAIATALAAAQVRGVRVRVICEHDNSGGSGFGILRSNGVPLIDDTYDPVDNGIGLMHDKFFVFDYVGGQPESVWVWGGSWNPTQPGTAGDRQNSIEIQDQALAGAYTTEFNLMWGSNTVTPNATNSRFGSRKSDIVPHNFIINNIPVSVYFSPSDHTTQHIANTMGKAQHSVASCIYTFTRKDIADTLIAKKNAGEKARIVMDNNTDASNQYAYLQSNGMDVHLKGFSGALLHHKYAVIDGEQVAGTSYLITGSHNWSNSAENSNDENTLIIQDRRAANLYLQEFAARYYEAGGTDPILINNSPAWSVNKTSINFDSVALGGSKQDSFIVTNTGNLTLNVSSATSSNARYTVNPTSGSIAPSGSLAFVVTYTPIATVTTNAKIILVHNAPGSPDTVLLAGRGIGSPAYSVNNTTLDFDSVGIAASAQDTFIVTNTGNAFLKISSVTSSNPRFTVTPDSANIAPSDSQVFIATFAPTSIGSQNADIVIFSNALELTDTVRLHGVGNYGSQVPSILALQAGWNMVSLPLKVSDVHKSVLFPHATSQAFAYSGSYVSTDSLLARTGYWVKNSVQEYDTLIGSPILNDTIPVAARWNMIGSITDTVLVSSITSDVANNISTPYYSYSGSYHSADTIFPGKAYWVKARHAGNLLLSAGPHSAPKITPIATPAGLNQLEITDAAGNRQVLYFGEKQEGDTVSVNYELPPVPPAGGFDARFATDNRIELHQKNLSQALVLPVRLQASKLPVTIHWTMASGKTYNYSLNTALDNQATAVPLINDGNTSISGKSSMSLYLSITPAKLIPERFALDQNYPNPFNPSTSVQFALPTNSHVKLTVYNAIGEEVATLVNGDQEAGYHTVSWQPNVSSGIYFYRLQAIDVQNPAKSFNQVKKMAFVK